MANVTGLPLVTAGNEIANVAQFLQPGRDTYTAAEVVQLLLGKVESTNIPAREDAQAALSCSASSSAGYVQISASVG